MFRALPPRYFGLARRLSENRPGLRVIFTSGYTSAELERHGGGQMESNSLEKPFEPSQLDGLVSRALAS